MTFVEKVQQLKEDVEALAQAINEYVEKDATNASAAQRIRKASLEVTKDLKDFRKDSVEHHKAK